MSESTPLNNNKDGKETDDTFEAEVQEYIVIKAKNPGQDKEHLVLTTRG